MEARLLRHVGGTPIRYLPVLSEKYQSGIYGKFEYFNFGMSSKDRPAYYMIKRALKEGHLRSGGTIVEATSGNTGLGVAIIAKNLGFSCQLFVTDKISDEKKAILISQGATVTVCPSSAGSEDPRSTYKMGEAYEKTHENSVFLNQYHNHANVVSHYETTGPEIYKEFDGDFHRFIAGAGTCGTISGVGSYLKEKDPSIKVIAVDAVGSILTRYFETGKIDNSTKKPYTIEGVGKGFIPSILDRDSIDAFVQVSDSESIHYAADFCRMEGHLIGYSSGAVLAALDKIKDELNPAEKTVLFFPDHGSRYLSKIYNKAWVETLLQSQKFHANPLL